ncbi:type II toxin-antitoxin system Phd/YefM family antitoxin [Eoetvoesiella caeni]|uniref:Antitoxin n=1 Tax=Eoetvoesiella caeni TaxID=645616 RepID=A0A366H409_9BURK|nr:type II toxin-antitoxin system Phd/YefM family antitoxin [Eoetvoesiella caeni]MCI2810772.1 type II toxin-antitoxin system Phd/YefM family antitoxin [Eoetvoesiella caeni]NYT56668.1 type II toxin-antitoxin system Phd/YefM family antitoxin [Eoetvoesiella caeni]RBP35824.1 antitoxin Phd_YefM of type II toxin-antitoxin system [Eoetvoesiella caeni]
MQLSDKIRSISYLKNNAAKMAEELECDGSPFIITQNGEASMVLENIERYEAKEELIALLKILALGEKDRLSGKGTSAQAFRQTLKAERT